MLNYRDTDRPTRFDGLLQLADRRLFEKERFFVRRGSVPLFGP